MDTDDGERIVQAAALLRGDLPDLRVGEFRELDTKLARAFDDADRAHAAELTLTLLQSEPDLAARLRTFERQLTTGAVPGLTRAVFKPPPGTPFPVTFTVWTCPTDPKGHFRRVQREANQDMGVCTEHDIPLVREGA